MFRERYNELLEQCRKMHSSIGTGSLAYTVGSKLMDVRVASNDKTRTEESPAKEQSKSHGAAAESLNESENLNLIVRELADVQGEISSSDEPRLPEPLPGEVASTESTQLQRKPGAGLVKKRSGLQQKSIKN